MKLKFWKKNKPIIIKNSNKIIKECINCKFYNIVESSCALYNKEILNLQKLYFSNTRGIYHKRGGYTNIKVLHRNSCKYFENGNLEIFTEIDLPIVGVPLEIDLKIIK